MTEDEKAKATQELFEFIGRYVVLFQWIEAKVEQGLLLLWGHENLGASKARISGLTNKKKVDALWKEFRENPFNSRGRSRPEWVSQFENLVARLHLERRRRNSLLHSHYLFDFLDLGEPVMQIDPLAKDGVGVLQLSDGLLDTYTNELVQLSMDMNFAHIQLIHDYKADD